MGTVQPYPTAFCSETLSTAVLVGQSLYILPVRDQVSTIDLARHQREPCDFKFISYTHDGSRLAVCSYSRLLYLDSFTHQLLDAINLQEPLSRNTIGCLHTSISLLFITSDGQISELDLIGGGKARKTRAVKVGPLRRVFGVGRHLENALILACEDGLVQYNAGDQSYVPFALSHPFKSPENALSIYSSSNRLWMYEASHVNRLWLWQWPAPMLLRQWDGVKAVTQVNRENLRILLVDGNGMDVSLETGEAEAFWKLSSDTHNVEAVMGSSLMVRENCVIRFLRFGEHAKPGMQSTMLGNPSSALGPHDPESFDYMITKYTSRVMVQKDLVAASSVLMKVMSMRNADRQFIEAATLTLLTESADLYRRLVDFLSDSKTIRMALLKLDIYEETTDVFNAFSFQYHQRHDAHDFLRYLWANGHLFSTKKCLKKMHRIGVRDCRMDESQCVALLDHLKVRPQGLLEWLEGSLLRSIRGCSARRELQEWFTSQVLQVDGPFSAFQREVEQILERMLDLGYPEGFAQDGVNILISDLILALQDITCLFVDFGVRLPPGEAPDPRRRNCAEAVFLQRGLEAHDAFCHKRQISVAESLTWTLRRHCLVLSPEVIGRVFETVDERTRLELCLIMSHSEIPDEANRNSFTRYIEASKEQMTPVVASLFGMGTEDGQFPPIDKDFMVNLAKPTNSLLVDFEKAARSCDAQACEELEGHLVLDPGVDFSDVILQRLISAPSAESYSIVEGYETILDKVGIDNVILGAWKYCNWAMSVNVDTFGGAIDPNNLKDIRKFLLKHVSRLADLSPVPLEGVEKLFRGEDTTLGPAIMSDTMDRTELVSGPYSTDRIQHAGGGAFSNRRYVPTLEALELALQNEDAENEESPEEFLMDQGIGRPSAKSELRMALSKLAIRKRRGFHETLSAEQYQVGKAYLAVVLGYLNIDWSWDELQSHDTVIEFLSILAARAEVSCEAWQDLISLIGVKRSGFNLLHLRTQIQSNPSDVPMAVLKNLGTSEGELQEFLESILDATEWTKTAVVNAAIRLLPKRKDYARSVHNALNDCIPMAGTNMTKHTFGSILRDPLELMNKIDEDNMMQSFVTISVPEILCEGFSDEDLIEQLLLEGKNPIPIVRAASTPDGQARLAEKIVFHRGIPSGLRAQALVLGHETGRFLSAIFDEKGSRPSMPSKIQTKYWKKETNQVETAEDLDACLLHDLTAHIQKPVRVIHSIFQTHFHRILGPSHRRLELRDLVRKIASRHSVDVEGLVEYNWGELLSEEVADSSVGETPLLKTLTFRTGYSMSREEQRLRQRIMALVLWDNDRSFLLRKLLDSAYSARRGNVKKTIARVRALDIILTEFTAREIESLHSYTEVRGYLEKLLVLVDCEQIGFRIALRDIDTKDRYQLAQEITRKSRRKVERVIPIQLGTLLLMEDLQYGKHDPESREGRVRLLTCLVESLADSRMLYFLSHILLPELLGRCIDQQAPPLGPESRVLGQLFVICAAQVSPTGFPLERLAEHCWDAAHLLDGQTSDDIAYKALDACQISYTDTRPRRCARSLLFLASLPFRVTEDHVHAAMEWISDSDVRLVQEALQGLQDVGCAVQMKAEGWLHQRQKVTQDRTARPV